LSVKPTYPTFIQFLSIKKAAAGWEEFASGGSPKEETLMAFIR